MICGNSATNKVSDSEVAGNLRLTAVKNSFAEPQLTSLFPSDFQRILGFIPLPHNHFLLKHYRKFFRVSVS
jgi:hypothetical protein